MDMWHITLIAVGGFAAGAMNALAGGGTFFSFPALLAVGIPPVTANATNAVALWPASLSTAVALRRELRTLPMRTFLVPIAIAAAVGGLMGGLLLLVTSDQAFYRLIPWLLLLATLLFTFSKSINLAVMRLSKGQPDHERLSPVGFFCQILVSLYGGFFGAGMGIMMIASLAISGRTQVLEINAIKSLLSSVIYSVAAVTFIIAGAIHWPAMWIMLIGTISGGYCGGLFARALPDLWLRWLVVAIGWGLSLFYFYSVYG
ncbi:MAG TPA: sulfite exporter TauE/SafE family protein [Pseudomonas xinjiangensis]|uniref:Membrane transporter protein n=2 Tax=root TaxID=1 RepID=A0A0F9U4E0_9ZZZZ|nr:sulfite exporter TauE/SafE family protein [Halopseudomonas xinjiangensis]HEC48861.1 sulfite exporter TauE/SafE family protein [Halopseudomonas xinjiangensis]